MLDSIFSGVLANLITDFLKRFRRNRDQHVQPKPDSKGASDQEVSKKYSVPEKGYVPDRIEFGTTLIRTPSLEELGIPIPFAYLPFIHCHVKGGDWVNRGDLLITVHLSYYKIEKKLPLLFKIFIPDNMFDNHTFELHSPVYGFVTDLRRVQCRNLSVSGYGGTFIGVIDTESVLPTILVPHREPTLNESKLNQFARQVCWSIANNWKRNVHNLGGGEGRYKRVRLNQAISENKFWSNSEESKATLRAAIQWAESEPWTSRGSDMHWATSEYRDYKTSYGSNLDEFIDSYRGQNLQLREKLSHLAIRGQSEESAKPDRE